MRLITTNQIMKTTKLSSNGSRIKMTSSSLTDVALDNNDPEANKGLYIVHPFFFMKLYPDRYLNVSEDFKTATVIVDGQPYTGESKPFQEALKTLKDITTQWNVNDTRYLSFCGAGLRLARHG